MEQNDEIRVEVASLGVIALEIDEFQSVTCDINVNFYPFDHQICLIRYDFKGIDSSELNILFIDKMPPVWSGLWQEDGTWDLVRTSCNKVDRIAGDKVCVDFI